LTSLRSKTTHFLPMKTFSSPRCRRANFLRIVKPERANSRSWRNTPVYFRRQEWFSRAFTFLVMAGKQILEGRRSKAKLPDLPLVKLGQPVQ